MSPGAAGRARTCHLAAAAGVGVRCQALRARPGGPRALSSPQRPVPSGKTKQNKQSPPAPPCWSPLGGFRGEGVAYLGRLARGSPRGLVPGVPVRSRPPAGAPHTQGETKRTRGEAQGLGYAEHLGGHLTTCPAPSSGGLTLLLQGGLDNTGWAETQRPGPPGLPQGWGRGLRAMGRCGKGRGLRAMGRCGEGWGLRAINRRREGRGLRAISRCR